MMIDPFNVFKRYTSPNPSPSYPFTSLPRSSTLSTSSMLSTLDPLPPARPPRLLRKPSHSDLVSPWTPGTPLSPYPPQFQGTGRRDGQKNPHPPLPAYSSFLALDDSRRAEPAFSLAQGEKRPIEGKPPRSGGFSIDKSRTRKHSFVPPSPRWERLPTIQGVMSIVSTPSASRRPSLVSPVQADSEGKVGVEERRRSLRGKKRTLELPIMPPPPCPSPPIPPVPPVRSASVMTGTTGSTGSTRSSYLTASSGARGHVSSLYHHPPSQLYPHTPTDNNKNNDNSSPSLSTRKFSGATSPQSLLSAPAASLSISSGASSGERTHRSARSASPLDQTPSSTGRTTDVDGESSIDFSEWDIISLHASPPRAARSPPSPYPYPPSPPRTSSLAQRHHLDSSNLLLDTSPHTSSVSVNSGSSQGTEIDATEVLETFKGHLTSEKWNEQLDRERQMLVKPVVADRKSGSNVDYGRMGHAKAEENPKGRYGNVQDVASERDPDSRSLLSPVSPPTTLPRPPLVPPRGASRPAPLVINDKHRLPEARADTPGAEIQTSPLSSPKKTISIRRREKRKSGPAETKTTPPRPQEVKSGGLIRSPTFNLPIHLRPLPLLPSESNTPPKSSLLNARFHTRLLRPKRPSTAPHPTASGSTTGIETRPSLPEALLSPRLKLMARDEPPAALGKRASDIADKRKGMTAMSFLALDDPSKTLSRVSSRTSLSKGTSSGGSSPPPLPASSSHGRKVSAKSIDWMVRSSSPAVTHIIPPAELSKIGAENRLKASAGHSDLMDDDDEMASRVALHGSAFDLSSFDRVGGEAKQRMRASLNVTTTNIGDFASASQSANDRRPSDPLPPTKHRSTGPVVPPRKMSQARSPRSPAALDPRLDRSSPIKAIPMPLPLQLDARLPSTARVGSGADGQTLNARDIHGYIGEDFAIFAPTLEARSAKTLPVGDRPSTLGRWDSPPLTPTSTKRGLDHVELGELEGRGDTATRALSTAPLFPGSHEGESGTARYGDNLDSSAEASALGDGSAHKASSEWSMDVQVGTLSKRVGGPIGEVQSPVSSDRPEEEALNLGPGKTITETAIPAEADVAGHPFLTPRQTGREAGVSG